MKLEIGNKSKTNKRKNCTKNKHHERRKED